MRTLTRNDQLLLAAALLAAGVKARIRRFPGALRVVFDGSWETVADVLNNDGFCPAGGGRFGRFNFEGNQVFVRGVQ